MSRIGRQTIQIPEGVQVSFSAPTLTVTGPKGTLTRSIDSRIVIEAKDGIVSVIPQGNTSLIGPLWGTIASHVSNMIDGVTKGFEKKLQIEGIGYKAEVKGETLTMSLGFSHLVNLPVPKGLIVVVGKDGISVSGIDKDLVGSFSALIRDQKKPEPYKGKGVRYQGEVVTMKQGKKSV